MRVSEPTSSLADLKPGETLLLDVVHGEESFRRRLYQLGFLPGSEIHVIRRMPAGGPIEVEIRGARMGLRVHDARAMIGRSRPLAEARPQTATAAGC